MRNLILSIFIMLLSGIGFGQISFYRLYSNNGADFGQGVVQLEDSSYVITGSSSSFANEASQAYLHKVDSMGEYIWSYHYGGPETDWGRRVLYLKNVGFYVCGFTNSYGNGGYDYYLFKTDENGTLEWEKTFGGTGWEKVHDAAMTRDTGVIMVGESSSTIDDNLNIYIVRTDKNGDTLWTKFYGSLGDDFLTSIRRYDDSTFVVAGQYYVEDSAFVKGYLAYMGDDGTIYWERKDGAIGNYWFNDLTFQGSLIVSVGGTDGPTKDGIDLTFNTTDIAGNDWGMLEIPNPGDHNNMLITTYGPSNNYLVPYNYEDNWTYPGGVDIQVSKYLTNFSWQLSFPVSHPDPDIPGQIIPTSDGGAIITGYCTGVVSGGNEAFLVKLGPNDSIPDYNSPVIDELVFLNEIDPEIGLKMYPNPSQSMFTVELESKSYNTIEVYNTLGELVVKTDISGKQTVDVSQLQNGYYLIKISGSNVADIRSKFIVAH